MCVIRQEAKARWTTLIKKILLEKHAIKCAIGTIAMGTARHANVYTTEA